MTVKLAFCLFKYFPFGGLQRDFMSIAKECLQRGHQVDVFTMQWEGGFETGLPVKILKTTGWQNHTRTRHFSNQIQQYAHQYDLVVGFNKMPGLDVYYAADTCYQAKVKTQRSILYRLTPRYRQLIAAEKAVFTQHTHVLLISKNQQNEFQHFYTTPSEHFHLLPPGIARDRIAPTNALDTRQTIRRHLQISEHELLILFIGSGFKTKGLDRALLSLAALPNDLRTKTHLYVIGQDHPNKFQRHAKQLGIAERIHFLGGRTDIPELLLAGDVLLHPAYNENTGTVLLEALAAGLPVLTTDICGYAHYIRDANAGHIVTSPFQQTQLNHFLLEMLSSKKKRLAWQKNAIHFCQSADIYSMPIHAVNLLESLSLISEVVP